MKHFDDISDDEIRIIGNEKHSATPPRKPFWRQWWFWLAVAALVVGIAIPFVHAILLSKSSSIILPNPMSVEMDTLMANMEPDAVAPTVLKSEPATVIICDTVINDVPLRLRTPVNAVPELVVGIPNIKDQSLILAFQAADIRADNYGIVGAFVLKGELLARGVAKKGFCAILDGKIQLGMAESTPLFEEAINDEGYFFRQYPLVSSGRMMENKPKGKALRHALCELDGRIVTVSSLDLESLHDFAQALADLGVQNAIYLVGKDAYGFSRSLSDNTADNATPEAWGELPQGKLYENVNFIVWRVPPRS